ncbi:acyltransferase family protein [Microbacterium sp. NPDC056234]|uniref:acyltransferase family protein n=1 Tax=Microbacterium sp. NPDC056234 TaxID=3345757 RepID=UPI0035D85926
MASPLPRPARTPRLDSLTGLRWWAALAVFVFHIRNIVPLPGPVTEIALYGNYGVAFFFILSGFVLTWSWRPSVGIGTFYWRRLARIYPLHLVTLLLAIPVFYSFDPDPAQTWVKPFDLGVLMLSLLLLQGWSRDPVILFSGNPAAWTLTAEMFFYALHPFITRVIRLFTGRVAMITTGILLALGFAARAVIIADPSGWLAELPWPVLRLNEFVIGMCLAWAFRQGWRPRLPVWIPVALLAGYVLAVPVLHRLPQTTAVHAALSGYTPETMVVLFALLICAFASADLAGRSRWSRARPLVALGEWSYAFYLIHATLIYFVLGLIGPQPGLRGVVWTALLLGAAILCAWALHVLIERPVESRLRAWQNGIVAKRAARRTAGSPSEPVSEPRA